MSDEQREKFARVLTANLLQTESAYEKVRWEQRLREAVSCLLVYARSSKNEHLLRRVTDYWRNCLSLSIHAQDRAVLVSLMGELSRASKD